jgi:cysteine desulfurase
MAEMVYLDYNASTPVDPRVLPAVVAASEEFGNPASAHHSRGQASAEIIEEARVRVGRLVGRQPQDVVLTSGATEAAFIGLVGAMLGAEGRPDIIVGATEHKAILAAAEFGARLTGGQVKVVPVDRRGLIDLNRFNDLLDDTVGVVAIMAANNETGVLAPIEDVANSAARAGALRFVDMTQLVGKGVAEPFAKRADIMVCSSHKIYGPKGAGALIASRHVQRQLVPLVSGGGQERGLRGGTPNTAGIAGFGVAAEIAAKEQSSDEARLADLSAALHTALNDRVNDVELNTGAASRLSNTLNLRFVGADAEAVMASVPEISVSTGSACQSAVPTNSHVLLAMGMRDSEIAESLRISLGRPTTRDEVETAVDRIAYAVGRVRELTRS